MQHLPPSTVFIRSHRRCSLPPKRRRSPPASPPVLSGAAQGLGVRHRRLIRLIKRSRLHCSNVDTILYRLAKQTRRLISVRFYLTAASGPTSSSSPAGCQLRNLPIWRKCSRKLSEKIVLGCFSSCNRDVRALVQQAIQVACSRSHPSQQEQPSIIRTQTIWVLCVARAHSPRLKEKQHSLPVFPRRPTPSVAFRRVSRNFAEGVLDAGTAAADRSNPV